jgi:hypothetical protein
VARVQVPPVTPPSVSAADLYAQVETAPHVSESPSAAPPPVRARPVAPPSVSGADIYAQVETAPERTRSVVGTLEAPRDRRAVGAPSVRASEDVPRSPYERALPTNPFD